MITALDAVLVAACLAALFLLGLASWKPVRAGLQWCHQFFRPHVDLLRGLFRLWIVIELLWSAYWIFYFVAHCYALLGKGWAAYGQTCPMTAYFAQPEFYLVISAFLVFPVIVFCCLYALILPGDMFVRLVWRGLITSTVGKIRGATMRTAAFLALAVFVAWVIIDSTPKIARLYTAHRDCDTWSGSCPPRVYRPGVDGPDYQGPPYTAAPHNWGVR